jgi:hypothetical protein
MGDALLRLHALRSSPRLRSLGRLHNVTQPPSAVRETCIRSRAESEKSGWRVLEKSGPGVVLRNKVHTALPSLPGLIPCWKIEIDDDGSRGETSAEPGRRVLISGSLWAVEGKTSPGLGLPERRSSKKVFLPGNLMSGIHLISHQTRNSHFKSPHRGHRGDVDRQRRNPVSAVASHQALTKGWGGSAQA